MGSKLKFEPPTEEHVSLVRKKMGTTEQDIKEAVCTLRSWLQHQPHLPDAIDDARIERMYINSKCSVERTKRALDAYFSLKHKLPELLMNRNPTASFLDSVKRSVRLFMMPGITEECYRVVYGGTIHPDPDLYHPLDVFSLILMWGELMLAEDYSLGDIIIYDANNVTVEHVVKTGVNTVRAAEGAWRTAYTRRIKGFHIVNAPKFADLIVALVKSAFPKKLGERVMTHAPGSKTLFDYVQPEFVADELGGTGGSAQEIQDACFEKLEANRLWLLEQDHYVSDESKRPPDSFLDDDFFGVEGSFKKLSVD